MGTVFYFSRLSTSAKIISVDAGDMSMLESNTSIATKYTG